MAVRRHASRRREGIVRRPGRANRGEGVVDAVAGAVGVEAEVVVGVVVPGRLRAGLLVLAQPDVGG